MAANVSEQGLFPVLIGDIGGTNARFALVPDREARLREFRSVATADFTTIEDVVLKVNHKALARQTQSIPLDISCLGTVGAGS